MLDLTPFCVPCDTINRSEGIMPLKLSQETEQRAIASIK
jgi:hypothetical protein